VAAGLEGDVHISAGSVSYSLSFFSLFFIHMRENCSQDENVKQSYHASAKDGGWVECNGNVGSNFWARTSAPSVTLLPSLLERGVEVLLFAGDQGARRPPQFDSFCLRNKTC
jgi:hypothetical protein